MEDRSQLKKYQKVFDKLPNVKYFVMWKETIPENLPA